MTARPVFARLSSPHFHACAMDGIAVAAKRTLARAKPRRSVSQLEPRRARRRHRRPAAGRLRRGHHDRARRAARRRDDRDSRRRSRRSSTCGRSVKTSWPAKSWSRSAAAWRSRPGGDGGGRRHPGDVVAARAHRRHHDRRRAGRPLDRTSAARRDPGLQCGAARRRDPQLWRRADLSARVRDDVRDSTSTRSPTRCERATSSWSTPAARRVVTTTRRRLRRLGDVLVHGVAIRPGPSARARARAPRHAAPRDPGLPGQRGHLRRSLLAAAARTPRPSRARTSASSRSS